MKTEIIKYELGVGKMQDMATFFLSTGEYVEYCGMPSENVFSLSLNNRPNLYYPRDIRAITLWEKEFGVTSVDPQKLILEYVKPVKK